VILRCRVECARYNAIMNLIALESSSEMLSIAVQRGNKIFTAQHADSGKQNAELALPALHDLLAESHLAMGDIDLIAVGLGPGAFTGVRVACGLAQGLAYGLQRRVIGMNSLLLLAEGAASDARVQHESMNTIAVAIDARMGEVYFACYVRDATEPTGFREVVSPMLCAPASVSVITAPFVAIGSGFDSPQLSVQLRERLGTPAAFLASQYPAADALCRLAMRLYAKQADTATMVATEVAPIYLRNHVAMTIDERRQHHAAKLQTVQAA
jgi:tRNA threonylcarbamoyladenosine biosynthesis protein TsaB